MMSNGTLKISDSVFSLSLMFFWLLPDVNAEVIRFDTWVAMCVEKDSIL